MQEEFCCFTLHYFLFLDTRVALIKRPGIQSLFDT